MQRSHHDEHHIEQRHGPNSRHREGTPPGHRHNLGQTLWPGSHHREGWEPLIQAQKSIKERVQPRELHEWRLGSLEYPPTSAPRKREARLSVGTTRDPFAPLINESPALEKTRGIIMNRDTQKREGRSKAPYSSMVSHTLI